VSLAFVRGSMNRFVKALTNSAAYRAYDRAVRRFDPLSIEFHVNEYSRAHQRATFIQVGANDGITWDPFYYFIRRDRWQGIVIEPQQSVFDTKLKATYGNVRGITLMNVAVDTTDGSRTLYRYSFSSSRWATGLASFDRERLVTNFNSAYIRDNMEREGVSVSHDPDSYLVAEVVPCVTFDTIVSLLFQDTIDFLITDVEGHDIAILDSFPLERVRPANIVFELPVRRDASLDRFQTKLREHGYLIKESGQNAIAMYRTGAFGQR